MNKRTDALLHLLRSSSAQEHHPRVINDLLTFETNRGSTKTVSTTKYEVTGRGGKGRELQKSGHFLRVLHPPVEPPEALRG